MRSRRKKNKALTVLQITPPAWTKDDGALVKQLVKSPTFPKLIAVLHGYLVNNILAGASDNYRRGYLAAIANLQSIGTVEDPLEDSEKLVSMQEFEDDLID